MTILSNLLQPRVKTPCFVDSIADVDNVARSEQIVVGDGAIYPMMHEDKLHLDEKLRSTDGEVELDGTLYVHLPERSTVRVRYPVFAKKSQPVHVMMRMDVLQALRKKHWFLSTDGYLAYGYAQVSPVLLVTGSFQETTSSIRIWDFQAGVLRSIRSFDIAGTENLSAVKSKLSDIMESIREEDQDSSIHLAYPVAEHIPEHVQAAVDARDIGLAAIKMAPPKPYRLKKASSTNTRKLIIGIASAVLGLTSWGVSLAYGHWQYKESIAVHESFETSQNLSDIYSANLLDALEAKRRFMAVAPPDAERLTKLIHTVETFSTVKDIYLKRIEYLGTNSGEYFNAKKNPKRALEYDFTIRFEIKADNDRSSLEQLKEVLSIVSGSAPVKELFNLRTFTRSAQGIDYREYDVGGRFCKACDSDKGAS